MNRLRTTLDRLRPTLPTTGRSLATLGVDVVVIVAFFVVGLVHHGITVWEGPRFALDTSAPFLIAWAVLSPLSGIYHAETLTSFRETLVRVPITWVLVVLVGGQLRASAYFHGSAPPEFILVNTGFGLLFLLPARLLSVWVGQYRSNEAAGFGARFGS